MKALQSLTNLFREHITDSARLDVWAEDGALFCGQSPVVDGYEVEYTGIVFLQNVNVQPQVLMMHLVSWLNQNDPARQEKGLAFPSFALEPLDKGRFDIKIRVDLQESYSLKENEQGNWLQQGVRYECVSEFEPSMMADDLGELVYFVGHREDLPCC